MVFMYTSQILNDWLVNLVYYNLVTLVFKYNKIIIIIFLNYNSL